MGTDAVYMNRLLCVLLLVLLMAIAGCEGPENRETVSDTVEELAGKKDLERYQQMKDELGEIQTQQTQRLQQLDSSSQTGD